MTEKKHGRQGVSRAGAEVAPPDGPAFGNRIVGYVEFKAQVGKLHRGVSNAAHAMACAAVEREAGVGYHVDLVVGAVEGVFRVPGEEGGACGGDGVHGGEPAVLDVPDVPLVGVEGGFAEGTAGGEAVPEHDGEGEKGHAEEKVDVGEFFHWWTLLLHL